jgi:tRNA(fMet)-specific endonuclease VapC
MQAQVSEIGVSCITLSELEYGVMKSAKPEQNKLALAQFIAPIEISAYDDVAAQHYGVIRAHLERQATPIGSLDMLIAAHALSQNSVLITNNESEFKRVSNLKIEIYIDLDDSHRILEQPFFQVICLFLHLFPFNVRCWTFDVQCSFFLIPPDT